MRRAMLTSKIHRATIIGSDLHGAGSVVNADLRGAADIRPHDAIDVLPAEPGASTGPMIGARVFA